LAGAVTGSDLVGRGAEVVAQLTTLGYSREQERQADSLGVRYLAGAAYDPLASVDALAALGAQTSLEARLQGRSGAEPSRWLSTHPASTERVSRIRAEAATMVARAGARAHNRDAFLNAIDGLPYDDDAGAGVVQGRSFRHSGLQLAFDAPQGFTLTNGEALGGTGPAGTSFELRPVSLGDAGLSGVAASRWQALGLQPRAMQPTRINGLEALVGNAQAQTRSGPVEVGLTVYRWNAQTAFSLISVAPQGQGAIVAPIAGSLRRMNAQESASVRMRRIEVVRVAARDTLASLAARMAYDDNQLERLLTLNQLPPNAALKSGDRIKLVVWR
jgi:predicted Zn-dependent protease